MINSVILKGGPALNLIIFPCQINYPQFFCLNLKMWRWMYMKQWCIIFHTTLSKTLSVVVQRLFMLVCQHKPLLPTLYWFNNFIEGICKINFLVIKKPWQTYWFCYVGIMIQFPEAEQKYKTLNRQSLTTIYNVCR